VRKGDLSKVRDVMEQTFGDFLERQLGDAAAVRPSAARSTSTTAGSWSRGACFVAEEDRSKIVGAALAVTWGTVGILGTRGGAHRTITTRRSGSS
jgi:hypothetical protein